MRGTRLEIGPGMALWRTALDNQAQHQLVAEIFACAKQAPFCRPRMPRSGKPLSVEETNLGSLGWISNACGYRYSKIHPESGKPWPGIPLLLFDLWNAATEYRAPPECCLVNLYRGGAKMGLHQDRDEEALDAPVLSVSLGDAAIFRIGGTTRRGPTKSLRIESGDVFTFGGPARLAFHGVDRIVAGTSALIPGGGRINLTLRRVTKP